MSKQRKHRPKAKQFMSAEQARKFSERLRNLKARERENDRHDNDQTGIRILRTAPLSDLRIEATESVQKRRPRR